MEKIKQKMQQIISYLIYDRQWYWLHIILSCLCDLEMHFKIVNDVDFIHELYVADIISNGKTIAQTQIPNQTLYCHNCRYKSYSELAYLFFGPQCCGYCYYLNNGDYRFIRDTELLWDGCKCCAINESWEDECEYPEN